MAFSSSPIRPLGDSSFLFLAQDVSGTMTKSKVAEVNNELLYSKQAKGELSKGIGEADQMDISKATLERQTQDLANFEIARGTAIRFFA